MVLLLRGSRTVLEYITTTAFKESWLTLTTDKEWLIAVGKIVLWGSCLTTGFDPDSRYVINMPASLDQCTFNKSEVGRPKPADHPGMMVSCTIGFSGYTGHEALIIIYRNLIIVSDLLI